MDNNRKITQNYAMRFGTYMGIFWALKFILFPIGLSVPIISILFVLLTLFVPILGYIFVKTFRDKYNDGSITFGRAFMFSLSMFLYATLLVAVVQYVYFNFIDNGFVIESYKNLMNEFESSPGASQFEDSFDKFREAIKAISALSPLELVFQIMSTDIYYGLFMSIPIALIVKRKKTNQI